MDPQTRLPSSSVAPPRSGSPPARERSLPVAVALFATLLYSAFSWSQWIRWEVPSWDNAIFTQLLSSYAAGAGPVVDIKGHGFNLLGDHFHPLLVLLTPVYALFPSALTVLLLQDVLLGISAGVVTRCAVRALRAAPAAAVGLAYTLSFGLQNAVSVQFHEIALAVPLLAAGLSALREHRWLAAALWSAPVALVKEDLGVTVAAVGALMVGHALRPALTLRIPAARRRWDAFFGDAHRPPRGRFSRAAEAAVSPPAAAGTTGSHATRRLLHNRALVCGAVLVAWGLTVTALAVGVVLPALNPAGEFAYADKLDVAGLLRDPASAVILQVVPARKLGTWLLLVLAGAVVAVRSPVALVALPTMVWRMLSPNDGYWGPGWHYSAVLMPVVFVALVDAVVRLQGGAARAGPRARVLSGLAAVAPWAALVVALAAGTQLPLARLADPAAWEPDPRQDARAAAVAQVPPETSVGTDLSLMNVLVSRADVHWIGTSGDPAPEYVVVDRLHGTWGGEPPGDVAAYAEEVYGVPYTVVSDEQNIAVVRQDP